jgi:DNA-binding CsgD family transcriptional regulator
MKFLADMGISPKTVAWHLEAAYGKAVANGEW